jgi:hypothetical protein
MPERIMSSFLVREETNNALRLPLLCAVEERGGERRRVASGELGKGIKSCEILFCNNLQKIIVLFFERPLTSFVEL